LDRRFPSPIEPKVVGLEDYARLRVEILEVLAPPRPNERGEREHADGERGENDDQRCRDHAFLMLRRMPVRLSRRGRIVVDAAGPKKTTPNAPDQPSHVLADARGAPRRVDAHSISSTAPMREILRGCNRAFASRYHVHRILSHGDLPFRFAPAERSLWAALLMDSSWRTA
jgi:hypothetical protein